MTIYNDKTAEEFNVLGFLGLFWVMETKIGQVYNNKLRAIVKKKKSSFLSKFELD